MYLSSYASASLGRRLVYLYYYGSIEKESNRMHTLRVWYHTIVEASYHGKGRLLLT